MIECSYLLGNKETKSAGNTSVSEIIGQLTKVMPNARFI